jgi:hypothetical protein
VGVVAARKLLDEGIGLLGAEPLGDQTTDYLLHVTEGLLGHVREHECPVVEPLERFPACHPDERGGRHVAELGVHRPENGRFVHDDLVGCECEEGTAGHGVVGHEHGDLAGMCLQGVRDLLGGEDKAAGRVQEEVDWSVVRRQADCAQDSLGVVDVDKTVERDPEQADGLLAVDHGNDAGATSGLQRRQRPLATGLERPPPEHRYRDQEEDRDREDVAEVDGASIGKGAARLATQVDGIFDWYLLGVVVGLGATAGAAASGARGRLAYWVLALVAAAGAVVVDVLALPLWALLPFAAAALAAWLGLRRLSVEALPAALLICIVLTALPALGYLAAVALPVAGVRLGRRAGDRHAGLRVLAKD